MGSPEELKIGDYPRKKKKLQREKHFKSMADLRTGQAQERL